MGKILHSRSKCAALICSVGVLGAPNIVTAADWSYGGFFSQRFETDSNINLATDDPGPVVGSITDLGLRAQLDTRTTRWVFAPGARLTLFTGPGDDGSLNSILPRFNGSVEHSRQRSTTSGSVSIVPELPGVDQFLDGSGEDGLSIRSRANLSHSIQIDGDDSANFFGFLSSREPLENTDSADSLLSFGGGAGWTRALSPRTDGSLTLQLSRFTSDSDTDALSDSLQLQGGVNHAVTETFDVGATFGAAFTSTERNGTGGLSEDETSVNFVGGVTVDYRFPHGEFSFGVEQTVDQGDDGEVESRIGANASFGYRVNDREAFSVIGVLGVQNPLFDSVGGSDNRQTLTVSPSYSVVVNRDWRANLGYRFRVADDDGFAQSHAVFVGVSRNFDF